MDMSRAGTTSDHGSSSNPISWLCDDTSNAKINCTASQGQSLNHWTVRNHKILYCYSLSMEEHCELRFSVIILLVVIICNFIKTLCTLITVWKLNEPTLVTIGGAISSFLQRPGVTTATEKPVEWDHQSGFWFDAASPIRWISITLLWALVFVSFQDHK